MMKGQRTIFLPRPQFHGVSGPNEKKEIQRELISILPAKIKPTK